jgi:hypothetical protein
MFKLILAATVAVLNLPTMEWKAQCKGERDTNVLVIALKVLLLSHPGGYRAVGCLQSGCDHRQCQGSVRTSVQRGAPVQPLGTKKWLHWCTPLLLLPRFVRDQELHKQSGHGSFLPQHFQTAEAQ